MHGYAEQNRKYRNDSIWPPRRWLEIGRLFIFWETAECVKQSFKDRECTLYSSSAITEKELGALIGMRVLTQERFLERGAWWN